MEEYLIEVETTGGIGRTYFHLSAENLDELVDAFFDIIPDHIDVRMFRIYRLIGQGVQREVEKDDSDRQSN